VQKFVTVLEKGLLDLNIGMEDLYNDLIGLSISHAGLDGQFIKCVYEDGQTRLFYINVYRSCTTYNNLAFIYRTNSIEDDLIYINQVWEIEVLLYSNNRYFVLR